MTDKNDKKQDDQQDPKNKSLKPDPETLHTTDPQDHMKGPISSAVQGVKDEVEENEEKDKKEGK